MLIVIAILALLMSLGWSVIGAKKAAEKRVFATYYELCVTTAEKKRNYLSNTLSLPESCEALGLKPPAGIKEASIQDAGSEYIITVRGGEFTQSSHLIKTISR